MLRHAACEANGLASDTGAEALGVAAMSATGIETSTSQPSTPGQARVEARGDAGRDPA